MKYAIIALLFSTPAYAQVINHDHPSQYAGKGEIVRPKPKPPVECHLVPHWRKGVTCLDREDRATGGPDIRLKVERLPDEARCADCNPPESVADYRDRLRSRPAKITIVGKTAKP